MEETDEGRTKKNQGRGMEETNPGR